MQYTVLITALIECIILFCKARIDFKGVSSRQSLSLEIIVCLQFWTELWLVSPQGIYLLLHRPYKYLIFSGLHLEEIREKFMSVHSQTYKN
jgi:hypothetical protein